MIKLLMAWDIREGKEPEYFEFIVREFSPALGKLGLLPSEAWYTVYGEGPLVLAGALAPDLETMQAILATEGWSELKARLMEYVTHYSERIVRATGSLQIL